MKKSVWSESCKLPQFDTLKGEHKTDVLIIGGGITGILCAYFLKNTGVDYVLVEADKICSGITKNTTAKINSQHGLIYNKLIREFGIDKAKMYLCANNEALNEYKKLCKNIDCDFEIKNSYVYSTDKRSKIECEINALDKLGYSADFVENINLPFKTKGAICFKNQAQFHPLKFITHISKDLNIFENTFVKDIVSGVAITNKGSIKADKIIVATHFPFMNKHGSYFLKLYQHRSYVSAFSGAEKIDGMYVDENLKGMSFRNYNDLLLIGGGSHRTGKTGGCWKEINDFAIKHYSDTKLQYSWATQDCMSLDGVPYIGLYSKNTPNLYVATGFNKWGMTSSMVAAKILCDMIFGKNNEYQDVFSPQRSIIKPQLLLNGFESIIGLLTPTTKRCSHFGCALKWNKYEHTWDCSCHGSRFTKDGKVIDNPATDDIT